jgi:mRNA interferase RelE/StbE
MVPRSADAAVSASGRPRVARFAWALAKSRRSGYNVARMRYDILLTPEAVEDLDHLKANARAEVRKAMERHLRHEPQKVSKSRVKRLRGVSRPQYRLRVGDDVRVFYDVSEKAVEVLGIIPKSEAEEWLKRYGECDEASGSV